MTRPFLYLPVILALGVLAWTSSIAFLVATVLVGIAISIPELRNARWINHHGHSESDTVIAAWFHAGYGIWKGAAAVVVIQGCFAAIELFWRLRPDVDVKQDFYELVFIAMGVASVLPFTGSILAWLFWVKVWVDPQLTISRNEETWPPIASRRNAYPWLLIPQILAALFAAFWNVMNAGYVPSSERKVDLRALLVLAAVPVLFKMTWARTPEQRWKMGRL